jgi:hypothetical protein
MATKDSDTSRAEQITAVCQYLHAPPNPTSRGCHFVGSTTQFHLHLPRPPSTVELHLPAATASVKKANRHATQPCLRFWNIGGTYGFLRYVLRRWSRLHSAPVARNILPTRLIAFSTRSLHMYYRSVPCRSHMSIMFGEYIHTHTSVLIVATTLDFNVALSLVLRHVHVFIWFH